MEASLLTLAALATSAVPNLTIFGYTKFFPNSSDETGVLLETDRGTLLMKLPLSARAEVKHSAEALAFTAISKGVRESLAFKVPSVLGMIGYKDTRAMVSTFLEGESFSTLSDSEQDRVCAQVARSIASIGDLPVGIVVNEGLPVLSTAEIREGAQKILKRAEETGLVPNSIYKRWKDVLETDDLWNFKPVVVHGSLTEDELLFDGLQLSGVLGWSELQISDPALDMAWLTSYPFWAEAFDAYCESKQLTGDEAFEKRAIFWQEFTLARWLLYGVEMRNREIIQDAISLFDQLIDRVANAPISTAGLVSTRGFGEGAGSSLSGSSATDILAQTPDFLGSPSDTAAFEALDDDRVFYADEDFGDFEFDSTNFDSTEFDPDDTRPIA